MKETVRTYPIDSSALIHLAVHNRQHSNVFRLEVHLRNGIDPAKLQRAADIAAACFPMLAAGIRKERNHFAVVPCPERLNIRVDRELLAYMSEQEIGDCAMRVLYGRHHVAVELFHSLTDGAGGLQFLKVLLAEYLDVPLELPPEKRAWEDSYKKYAAGKATALPGGNSCLLPPAPLENSAVCRTTWRISAKELQSKLQGTKITVTAFFTALFAKAAMDLQKAGRSPGEKLLPARVMVPVDLRRRFPSVSARNFSLYVLPQLTPEAAEAPLSGIAENMAAQIRIGASRLKGMAAANALLERRTSLLPLGMKCAALKAGFEFYGGRSSCITVSNLGRVDLPEGVRQEITRLDFMLTPRMHSPYNCGIATVDDTLSLTVTRRGAEKGLEKMIAAQLERSGLKLSAVKSENVLK